MSELIAPAIIAAVVSGMVALIIHFLGARRAKLDRRREIYAKAFSAYTAYCEFPYTIRRRRPDKPEAERIRISEQLQAVQERISFYSAWVALESKEVTEAYEALIANMRTLAGKEMNRAWTLPPPASDTEMNVRDIDVSGLTRHEVRYLRAVRDHLALTPTALRKLGRKLGIGS